MTAPLNLALTLSLNDRLVGPLKRALDQAERELRDVSRELGHVGRQGTAAADGLAKVGTQAQTLRNTTSEVRKLGQEAAETERKVRGMAGAWAQVRNVTRGVAGAVAGGAAFSAVVAAPVRRAADYDTQLRYLSNTAYAGQSLDVRRAGVRTLDAAITGAVRFGGGTREGAVAALNDLAASGLYKDPADAMRLLPLLQRAETASGASAKELGGIASRAQKTFEIPANRMSQVFDMAMAAGQAGGFELRDMAKWLPEQMAAARQIGITGESGLARLLASNQASVVTAGSTDQAGNNLMNLLAKISSEEAAGNFKKLGIDLPGSLAAASAKGVNGLDAYVNLVERVVAKDPRYAAARKAADEAKNDPDRQAALSAQADILQGSVVGKTNQDRQAAMALIAEMRQRRDTSKLTRDLLSTSTGSIQDAAALMQEGAGYKFDQRNFEVQRAQTEAMNAANGTLTKLAEAQTELYQKYPGFSEAVEGAKVAVTGFSAALIASGLVGMLDQGWRRCRRRLGPWHRRRSGRRCRRAGHRRPRARLGRQGPRQVRTDRADERDVPHERLRHGGAARGRSRARRLPRPGLQRPAPARHAGRERACEGGERRHGHPHPCNHRQPGVHGPGDRAGRSQRPQAVTR